MSSGTNEQVLGIQKHLEIIAQMVGIPVKNAWFRAKEYGIVILDQGFQSLKKAGNIVCDAYSDAIKAYCEMTAERAKGIIVIKENEAGELIVRATYNMKPAKNSGNPLWTIFTVVRHLIGLDPKPTDDHCEYPEPIDDGSIPKVTMGKLAEIEIIEDFVSDVESEREQQRKFDTYFGKGDVPLGSIGIGSKVDEMNDDGSYLFVILDKERDEDEQIKELEKNIAQYKYDVTVIKKETVLEDNRITCRTKSSPPITPLQIGPDTMIMRKNGQARKAGESEKKEEEGEGEEEEEKGNDDDDDDDDVDGEGYSFRFSIGDDN